MAPDNNSALPIGYMLGEYKIEAVIGHGGFGITYLAHDRQLGTKVAIKEYFPRSLAARGDNWVIHPLPGSNDSTRDNFTWGLQQFLEEARALGQFKHSNIVRVLRFLEANGTAYMVMEFEEGQSLARQLVMRGGRIDEQSLLRVFVPILNGLQAVHDACLLHRDIKPDNIYLRLDGTPMLIDFGSVRQVTQAGDTDQPVVLTPAYAAIEQYPGQGEEGRWTDVYAIGASMYRCITGNQPIGGFQRYEAIRNYQSDPLTLLTELKPEGYSEFVLRCVDWAMQLYPRHRPMSARELQDGLMGIRKPDFSAFNALAVPGTTATDPSDTAASAEDFTPVADTGSSLDRFRIALASMAVLLLVSAIGISTVFSTRHSSSSASETQAVSTDSRAPSIATVKPAATSTSPLRAVRHLRDSYDPLEATSFVPSTDLVVAASRGGGLIVWNIDNGREIGTLNRHRRTVRVLEPLGRGSLVAAGDDGGNILIWDFARQKAVQRLDGHRGAVLAMAAAPDHHWLATGGRDQRVILWSLIGDGKYRVLATNLGRISALAVSPNGDVIAAGTTGGIIHLLDSESGIIRKRIDTNGGGIESLAFSGDGTLLAAGGISHSVSLWRPSDGQMMHRLRNPGSRAVYGLVFARDGRRLYVGDTGGRISLWNSLSGAKIATFPAHQGAVRDLGLTPDGHTLASAGADNMLILWAVH